MKKKLLRKVTATETSDSDDGVTPLEAIGEAARAAFEGALGGGATAEEAFTAAAEAAAATASDLGMSEEISSSVITGAQEAFAAAIADGATATEAFEAQLMLLWKPSVSKIWRMMKEL